MADKMILHLEHHNILMKRLKNKSNFLLERNNLPKIFGGPSIYFHNECIKAGKKDFLSDRHLEMLYATLCAWGMHRMGPSEKTKTKLVLYKEFVKSIRKCKNVIFELRNIKMKNLKGDDLDKLKPKIKELFLSLKISESDSMIVSNSKTMHHLLWDLIPPVDRQYTIRFYKQKTFYNDKGNLKSISIPKDKIDQFEFFWLILEKIREIIGSGFDKQFKASGFINSDPKIADDLIMIYVKTTKS